MALSSLSGLFSPPRPPGIGTSRQDSECEASLLEGVPELPEVEITARRLSAAMDGAEVESALATGVATLKTFDPSLDALDGAGVEGVRRIGKMLAVDFAADEQLTLLIHLMSAGRLQLFDKRGSLKDRASRLLVQARRRARAAPARVRHPPVGLGPAAAPRRRRRRGDGRDPRPGRLAGAPARALRRADRPGPPPPPPAAKAEDDRRHRPLLGGRDPLGGEAVALQEGLGAARRGDHPAPLRPARPWRRARPLRGRSSARPSPTSSRCPCRSTAARASPARAAAPRSRRSSTPSTRPTTARKSRPAAGC